MLIHLLRDAFHQWVQYRAAKKAAPFRTHSPSWDHDMADYDPGHYWIVQSEDGWYSAYKDLPVYSEDTWFLLGAVSVESRYVRAHVESRLAIPTIG